jgi:hypothetical protein
MPKPNINSSLDELRNQMARGLQHGASPGSASNVMPGPSALSGMATRAPSGGGSAGLTGIPSRTGAVNPVRGTYQGITGSPAGGTHAVTPGHVGAKALAGATPTRESMLAHGRLLGAVKTVRAMHGDHPHLQSAHAKATAHIAAYTNMNKTQMAAGPKFGSLGGSAVPGAGGGAPGAQPLGMAKL